MTRTKLLTRLLLLCLLGLSVNPPSAQAGQATGVVIPRLYLPLLVRNEVPSCPQTSTNTYSQGNATQYDMDDPPRPTGLHADKNIALRGYQAYHGEDYSFTNGLINLPMDDPVPQGPPQLATLFNPNRVPTTNGVNFPNMYRSFNWNWATSPTPGTRGTVLKPPSALKITGMGMRTTPGEAIHVPYSAREIAAVPRSYEAMLLYADQFRVALRYTVEDSSGSPGYTLFINNLCVDRNLLALYRTLDANANRYKFFGRGQVQYQLPYLAAGDVVGTASGSELIILVSDTGGIVDPRACTDFWSIRPGYGTCFPPD